MPKRSRGKDGSTPPLKLKDLRAVYERQLIYAALAAAGWNQRRAASALGVLPTTLHEKMKRLGLLPPGTGGEPAPDPPAEASAGPPTSPDED